VLGTVLGASRLLLSFVGVSRSPPRCVSPRCGFPFPPLLLPLLSASLTRRTPPHSFPLLPHSSLLPVTEIINTTHENVKYLPGIPLPSNILAVPDLATASKDATLFIFVVPHQFLPKLLPIIKSNASSNARAISLIKGIDFDTAGIKLISRTISDGLGADCGVLMGANVANEVAKDEFCEATVGCANSSDGEVWRKLFDATTFSVRVTDDVVGVELAGALKNVVALGAGFCDGMGYGGESGEGGGLVEPRRGEVLFAFVGLFFCANHPDERFR